MNTKITIDDGIILRDGAGIGTYNAERNVAWFPKYISTHLYAAIGAAIGRKPTFKFATPEELAAGAKLMGESAASESTLSDPAAPASSDSDLTSLGAVRTERHSDALMRIAIEAGRFVAAPARSPVGRRTRVPLPDPEDAPAKDPRMGDKTPAFMAWYLAERGEAAFQARYGHRNCPALPGGATSPGHSAAAGPTTLAH